MNNWVLMPQKPPRDTALMVRIDNPNWPVVMDSFEHRGWHVQSKVLAWMRLPRGPKYEKAWLPLPPTTNDEVFVWVDYNGAAMAFPDAWDGVAWRLGFGKDATHWMPIPPLEAK